MTPRHQKAAASLAALLALAVLSACAPEKGQRPQNPLSAPAVSGGAGEKTFRWAKDGSSKATSPGMASWRGEIRRAIQKELKSRGYSMRRVANAEMAFRMVFSDGSVAGIGDFSRRRTPAAGEGMFMIEAREPGTDEIIWRTAVAAPISPAKGARDSRSAIEALVGAMLKALPPIL